MFTVNRQTECRSDIHRLDAPFLAVYGSLQQTDEESKKQKQFLALLENHVHKEWPAASLHVFGSAANSFGLKNSDIDVCILMDGPYYVQKSVNKSEILLKLTRILRLENFQDVEAVTSARVPIVKCKDPVTGISCDICVNNLLAVINTKLLGHYAQIDSRLQQLAFIVKQWAKSRRINKTYHGTLSSYAYVLMCIHFLQRRTPAILPCLQGLDSTFEQYVDNTECAYFDQVEELHNFGSRNRESIAQLVWEFFNYWAYHHDYANHVISVRTGRLLSKMAKRWNWSTRFDRHLMCIEDPFEISHNLGRSVDAFSLGFLKTEFKRAAEIMQYDPNPCVKLFEP